MPKKGGGEKTYQEDNDSEIVSTPNYQQENHGRHGERNTLTRFAGKPKEMMLVKVRSISCLVGKYKCIMFVEINNLFVFGWKER